MLHVSNNTTDNNSAMTIHSDHRNRTATQPQHVGESPSSARVKIWTSSSPYSTAGEAANRSILTSPSPQHHQQQHHQQQRQRPVYRTETSTYRDHYCDEEQPLQPYSNPHEYARSVSQRQAATAAAGVWGADSPLALPQRRAPPHVGKPRSRVPGGYVYKSTNFMNDAPSHVQLAMGFRFGPEPPLPAKVTQFSPWKPLDAQDPLPTLDKSPPSQQQQQQCFGGAVPYPQEPDLRSGGFSPSGSMSSARQSQQQLLHRQQLGASVHSLSKEDCTSPLPGAGNPYSKSVQGDSIFGQQQQHRPEMTSLLVEVDERLQAMGVTRGIAEIRYASDKALDQLLQSLNFSVQERGMILEHLR